MNIIENEMEPITFNFFRKDNCTDFKFCHAYKSKVEYIRSLVQMTPEERLKSLQPFLQRGDKGESCEFYFQGDFYECGIVSERDNARADKAKKMAEARNSKKDNDV